MREFLYVEDLARACVFLLENYSEEQFINVGSGKEVSVRELTETIQRVVGFGGGNRVGQDQTRRHAAQVNG